ncbi:RNA-binding S4 domain-containing protein [Catellicoccus marimammalium]|uniref:RQC P-site tRNA stabilizing factor n=1 Tax=Catellicoccus marimammalium M35/04/3 TaxID=1234409 RepID=K8ZA88_9ENTE|nr:RNA-binding S4 domain-containing protein [Catellicoccus marimammalium]EKU27964.1 Ribosome-associated heat shock protein implicated in the recycling of the 50S subunit [Catellicoccus marimammalium M35/04/3]
MRIDKFLKVSRIIKRRQVAKEVADQGRIWINEKQAKCSTPVKVGDQITIRFGHKKSTFEVLEIMDSTKKKDASEMYRLVSEERIPFDENGTTKESL